MNVPEPFGDWPGNAIALADLIVPALFEPELEGVLAGWLKKNIVRPKPAKGWELGKWRARRVTVGVTQNRLNLMLPYSSSPAYDILAFVASSATWKIRAVIGPPKSRPNSVLLARPRLEFHRLCLQMYPSMIVDVTYYTI